MPQCSRCYGKGYGTEYQGSQVLLPDFIGDTTEVLRQEGVVVRLCTCARGKDLNKFFTIKKEFSE